MLLFITVSTFAQEWHPQLWPVLKTYNSDHLEQIALPLGGIGTGTVSLGGRGELRDWEIMNTPAKGYSTVTTGNNAPFFSIFIQSEKRGIKHFMHVTDKPGTYFWSNGYAWGNFTVKNNQVIIEVLYGELKLKQIQIGKGKIKKCKLFLKAGERSQEI